MGNSTKYLNVEIDLESLVDVPVKMYDPLFRTELEQAFPNTSISIQYHGHCLRVACSWEDPMLHAETVWGCGERAINTYINKLNK